MIPESGRRRRVFFLYKSFACLNGGGENQPLISFGELLIALSQIRILGERS